MLQELGQAYSLRLPSLRHPFCRSAASSKPPEKTQESVASQVDARLKKVKDQTSDAIKSQWQEERNHTVPYRFRIRDPPSTQQPSSPQPYTNFSGLRFPTLETAENIDYHKDRGLQRVVERAYPIKVPGHRRLDPYLREYIHFLHNLDPARFTTARIAERYRLRQKTVHKVVKEWSANHYITNSGLTKLRDKQVTREAVILQKKEEQYAKWVGWDQLGDGEDPETDDEGIGEYRGWRATNDWVRRQNVEVESMSAFPMMEKRDPMPKRVDADLVVDTTQHHKVINWIDPTDKVVF